MLFENVEEKRMLAVYGWGHALIDAVSAALVLFLASKAEFSEAALLIILYNVLAFGLQPLFGVFANLKNKSVLIAIIGNLIAAVALFSVGVPILATCLVGIANAMFHVGGGIAALRIGKGTASAPGLYVAPGAIGLFLGGLIGVSGNLFEYGFLFLLLLTTFLVYFVGAPLPLTVKKMKAKADFLGLALLLFLLVIGSRALVGFSANFVWKQGFEVSLILVSTIALGKALGGIMGDRFGWKKVAIGALIISAPLLSFGASYALLGILGVLLFNFSMPITLSAIARMMPGLEGLAFGLTTLSLISGSLLAFAGISNILKAAPALLFVLIILSAVALYLGLNRIHAD